MIRIWCLHPIEIHKTLFEFCFKVQQPHCPRSVVWREVDWRVTDFRIKEEDKMQLVCDYVAGMTDRFALQEYKKLFDPFEKV